MTQPSKAGQGAAAALLAVGLLLPVPAAAEPAPGFGFAGVVEVPEPYASVALDDGRFAINGENEVIGYGADGRVAWRAALGGFVGPMATDGERVLVAVDGESLVALDEDGGRDTSFGGGDGELEIGAHYTLLVDDDDRILVGRDGDVVTRLLPDGSTDAQLSGVQGFVTDTSPGGAFITRSSDLRSIRRYTESGALDTAWGDAGVITPQGGNTLLDVGPDGSLVGYTQVWHDDRPNDLWLSKWKPTGDPDPSFGLGGRADGRARCASEDVRGLAVGADGSIHLIGASANVFDQVPPFVSRFSSTGRLVGFETLGTSSPYQIIGRDVHTVQRVWAQSGAGRVLAMVSTDARRTFVHALDASASFDGPEPDSGYWLVHRDGPWPRGTAPLCAPVVRTRDIVGAAHGAQRNGYWMVDAAGRVETAGRVAHHGEVSTRLNAPVLGITARPQGDGYWIVAGDGGIFSFGGATFHGSTGAIRLNQPILGMAGTRSGSGYWLVARDGGIFSFGDAQFFGSTGAIRLNQPVVGMASTPSGKGYWLVARDGGIFSFGDAQFFGSTGAIQLNQPIVGMAPTSTGRGYRMIAADGGVFTFGDAEYLGSSYDGFYEHQDFVGIMTP